MGKGFSVRVPGRIPGSSAGVSRSAARRYYGSMNKPLVAAVAGVVFGGVLSATLVMHLLGSGLLAEPAVRAVPVVPVVPVPIVLPEAPSEALEDGVPCRAATMPEAQTSLAADWLLNSAQRAYEEGNYPCVQALARKARRVEPLRAWRLLGATACQQRDSVAARQALVRLDGPSRGYLITVCAASGLVFERGHFRAAGE